uniref:mannosyl-oligosaccharide 1,3-1,6-alpha-mannosidase n=1 Tax=Plectus sambesii TaxID=2011161 RepID=A0A914XKE6_9BILA
SIGKVVNGGGPKPGVAADSKEDNDRRPEPVVEAGNKVQVVHQFLNKVRPTLLSAASIGVDVCALSKSHSQAKGDVQMLDIYEMLPFDNPDGGVWKQGWEITYDSEKIKTEPKLEVVVIPHSHDDPGWIKTFEKYYQDQTRHILDGMVKKLGNEPKMKFIYAEMSFFERWWRDTDQSSRDTVKRILTNGQLEIVTGAWVMTDEANAHYFATIDQMIEGHQWLKNHLDYQPTNHWSIDPFGLSPSIAYILKKANMTNMVIQRVHYVIKRHLAKNKQLEFMWRQLWSGDSDKTDISAHMFPFYSYDVPHTCGPDPKICCQFDFKRLPSGGISCPWNVPPQPIDSGNVAERARTLADQYRKKAQLYKANTLLIPLGDDFRYDTPFEWDMQFENYMKLFEQMNSQSDLNIHARFGTLADYFKVLHERESQLPILSGDFFTYADRDDHYWSGYFTSRPFYKRMDRVLQHRLRAAEIAFTLSVSSAKDSKNFPSDELYQLLVSARRNLALFQHHDGVTGTAKDGVVADYGQRMLDSIHACEKVLAASAEFLLKNDKAVSTAHLSFQVDERRSVHDSYPMRVVANAKASTVVIFNPLAQKRREVACVVVDSPDAQAVS